MITEEKNFELTIMQLEDCKQKLGDQIEKIDQCIETLKLVGFGENRPTETKIQKPPPIPHGPAKHKRKYKKRKADSGHIAGLRGPRNQASQYKGVSLPKPKKDGKQKFRVQFWKGKLKKNIPLGLFDSELEGAAVYQDHVGNKVEAARLRALDEQRQADMAEQAENNQDRPPAKKRKKTKMIYVCKQCGLEWQSKPKECPHCGNDDFREVPGGSD